MTSSFSPNSHSPRRAVLLALLLLVDGCAQRAPYELSDADKHRFVSVVRVPAQGTGDPQIFALDDCTVYKASTAQQRIVDWHVVLRSDWGQNSPKFMTVCTRQALSYAGGYVRASFCAQGIGAGGGCIDGGNYRSRDGEHHWEISGGDGPWRPLPK